jgi:hypothetical protein
MFWIVPMCLSVIQGLVTYLIWRKVAHDCPPQKDATMLLMLVMGASVMWGLFGVNELNNWYWGFDLG